MCGYLTPVISSFKNTDVFCNFDKDISHITFCGNFTGDYCDCVDWCNSFDDWYDTTNITWEINQSECKEIEKKEQEQRNYTYVEGEIGCEYLVEGTRWVDTRNTCLIPHCGAQVPLLTPLSLIALAGALSITAVVMIRKN